MNPPFRSYVLVSRERIAANYRAVREVTGPGVEVVGVVKADAYGHGAVEVARVLVAEGARWLAVSSVDEGVTLRQAGIGTRILVMAGFLRHEGPALAAHDLTPVVHSLDDLAMVEELGRGAGKPLRYHLKIDSGMGRLGVTGGAASIRQAVNGAAHAKLEGLMTHFASAANYSSAQTDEQVAYFHRVHGELGLEPEYVHMCSSNAIGFGRREAWHNMVRAGHALYGYVSPARGAAPAQLLQVAPALVWKARILAVKDVPEGAAVGYGAIFRAPQAMRIAMIGAGYADGVFHRLSNRGQVIAAGKLTRILGSISMDMTTVDVSHAPELVPGDTVTLLGREGDAMLDAQQIARVAGTISYNVLCSISARVRRVYI